MLVYSVLVNLDDVQASDAYGFLKEIISIVNVAIPGLKYEIENIQTLEDKFQSQIENMINSKNAGVQANSKIGD